MLIFCTLSTEVRRRGLSQKAVTTTTAGVIGLTSPVTTLASPLFSESSGFSSKPTSSDSVAPGEGKRGSLLQNGFDLGGLILHACCVDCLGCASLLEHNVK
jgi:hypothetical protein